MWLQIRSGDDAGRVIEVPDVADRPFVLGRVRGSDYVIRDERASRRHVRLTPLGDGRMHLLDLGSANGTFVDGRRTSEEVLGGGEEIHIGGVRMGLLREKPAEGGPKSGGAVTVSMVRNLLAQSGRGNRRLAYAGVALGAIAVIVAIAVFASGGESAKDKVPGVVNAMKPSTVLVEALRAGARSESGSGWVLDAGRGEIATNAHVVNGGETYRVAGRPAKVVGVAPCDDLAVLRVTGARGLRTAPQGRDVVQGATVVALGYPAGAGSQDELSSTVGVVSVPHTTFGDPAPDVPHYPDAILTDTALNPGNSGGPLVDLAGRVVGINSAARTTGSDGRALQGQNYAIAIAHAQAILAQLRTGRSKGWLGYSLGFPDAAELVKRKLPPGLSLLSGPNAGDVIAAIDGRPVSQPTLGAYCTAMGDTASGDSVTLTLARDDGTRHDVRVHLR